LFRILFMVEKL